MLIDANTSTPGKAFVPIGMSPREMIRNFNECHDEKGLFCEGGGNTTVRELDPRIKAHFENIGSFSKEDTSGKVEKENIDRIPMKNIEYGDKAYKNRYVGNYCSSSYNYINRDLRDNKPLEGKTKNAVDQIDLILEKSPPLPKDIEMWRGVGSNQGSRIAALNVGDEISDAAYQSFSTSASTSVAYFTKSWKSVDTISEQTLSKTPITYSSLRTHKTLIRAITTERLRGVYISKGGEGEILINRGQSWRIADKTQIHSKGGHIYDIVTVIPK